MEFLIEYRLLGLFIGVCTFLIIGLFHPVVVKAEYYWGTRCWWVFLLLGLGGMAVSLLTDNVLLAALAGVFAFSSLWTIKELFEQRERVAKGWFPANPKRKGKKSYTPGALRGCLSMAFLFCDGYRRLQALVISGLRRNCLVGAHGFRCARVSVACGRKRPVWQLTVRNGS